MENHIVSINYCNNIVHAQISLLTNAVNIKFGYNGTGKSTISKAIKAKADSDMDALQKLKPFGSDKEVSVNDLTFQKVVVFNEDYVQKYVIQNNASFDDSYSVLIRTAETESLSAEINKLLSDLHSLKVEKQSISEINQLLGRYSSTVQFTGKGISKRGGVGEVIKGSGFGFDKYPELKAYRPFYTKKLSEVGTWAKWRTDGIRLMDAGSTCPFCTSSMDMPTVQQQNETISKVFKSSALKTAQDILEYLQEGISLGFIVPASIVPLENYLGDTGKEAEITAELTKLAAETNYFMNKIQQILSFAPMNVTREQLDHIDETLQHMKIDHAQLSNYYNTTSVLNLTDTINNKIDILLSGTGKLRGLFNQHETKIQKMIENRESDINDFLTMAGFPYQFIIRKQGDRKATTKLIPVEQTEIDMKAGEHLSWGEKNAFALVMFMLEAVSEDADLIVLDDPISAFDTNKKFAIMKRMFDSNKPSFRNKTVLMLTHDLEPIIDYIHTDRFGEYGITARAVFLTNEAGIIREQKIENSDLLNVVTLTEKLSKDSAMPLPVRIVNLRKYIELTVANYQETATYHVLSSLIHGRERPSCKDGQQMDASAVEKAMEYINNYLPYNRYDIILCDLSTSSLVDIAESDNTYAKIIAIRLLFERKEGLLGVLKKKSPAAAKFLNETNHIENDYVFQLNPCKFFEIPERYLSIIGSLLANNKSSILAV